MSQVRDLLVSTADTLFSSVVTKETIDSLESGRWPAELWQALAETGLHQALIPEELGGAGVTMADAMAILQVAGRHALPAPLAETLLAGWMLAHAGLEVEDAPLTLAPVAPEDSLSLSADGAGWALTGTAHDVPWARFCTSVVTLAQSPDGDRIAKVELGKCRVVERLNLAGEPRDTLMFESVPLSAAEVSAPDSALEPELVASRCALSRVALMSGALAKVLEISVDYARERIQFGRPIGRFQAIQQQLAVVAGEVAAAVAAADAAAELADHSPAIFEITCAKARISEAVGPVTAIAHQVHGAIGFTQEHELHHKSRRLWAWREEFGSEHASAVAIGRAVSEAGADGFWSLLTTGHS